MRTAILAGASGLVGGHLLRVLLDDPCWSKVLAVVRRPLGVGHPKLQTVEVDFDKIEAQAALLKADDAFCCLGATLRGAGGREAFRRVDFDAIAGFARGAARAGARRFLLVSSVGAAPSSRAFYLRVKGEAEDAVRACGIPEVHLFRPSYLLGERREPRPLERLGIRLATAVAPLLKGGWTRYRPVEAARVARAMAAAAKAGGAGRVWESDAIAAETG